MKQPLSIGSVALTSPHFFAPINTGLARAGDPTDSLIRFHASRTGLGVGISYVGNVAIRAGCETNATTLAAGGTSRNQTWAKLVAALGADGTVPGVQLACDIRDSTASRSWRGLRTEEERAARSFFGGLTTHALSVISGDFVRSAAWAFDTGFKVVQLHAAHGYLLAMSLNRAVNHRTDRYGRLDALASEILEGIRRTVPGLALDIRLSLSDFRISDEDDVGLIRRLSVLCDMISWSSGSYRHSRGQIYPSRGDGMNTYIRPATEWALRFEDCLWNVAGNIRSRVQVPRNLTCSFGRPMIANPGFLRELAIGTIGTTTSACTWSGKCHYFSRGRTHIECPMSPDLVPAPRNRG